MTNLDNIFKSRDITLPTKVHLDATDMSVSKLRELVMDREAWCAACSPWGHKELDTTERLNSNDTDTPTHTHRPSHRKHT